MTSIVHQRNKTITMTSPNQQDSEIDCLSITCDGYVLGTLCVMVNKPRELDAAQRNHLQKLASTATALIEAKRIKEIKRLSIHYRLDAVGFIKKNS